MIQSLVFPFAIAIVLYAAFRTTLFPYLQKRRGNSRLQNTGIEAIAMVLAIQLTGHYINHLPQVRMQMNVHPATGKNFVTDTKQVVTPLQLYQLRAGSYLKVRYNPRNTKQIVILR